MVEVSREITKEQYNEYKDRPRELGNELISPDIFMGYGVNCIRLVEKDGKYYLRYDRGSTCD